MGRQGVPRGPASLTSGTLQALCQFPRRHPLAPIAADQETVNAAGGLEAGSNPDSIALRSCAVELRGQLAARSTQHELGAREKSACTDPRASASRELIRINRAGLIGKTALARPAPAL